MAKSGRHETRSTGSAASGLPSSKCVAAVEARCPPAEKPQTPTRFGSTPKSLALARTVRPDLALTGDVMVGFPGESADDFQRTLDAIERAGFMDLHVFRFSPRPRTAAARYPDQVPVAEAKERSRRVIELGHRLGAAYRRTFEGRPLDVIWDRVAAGRKGLFR